jgi:hypothetical protein
VIDRADKCKPSILLADASHYLTSLGTPRAIQFLEQTYNQEPNNWVQRGIMVGLALYCNKTDILEQYITMIRNDPEVASINLGTWSTMATKRKNTDIMTNEEYGAMVHFDRSFAI